MPQINNIDRQLLSETKHPLYIERIENWRMSDNPKEPPARMHSAYNHQGHYIGDMETAQTLCDKYGIAPELARPDSKVCSIGYSAKHDKWFGWSHRALSGFKIGDKLFEEKFGDDNTPFTEHGSQTIENSKQARLAAKRFAASVASVEPVIVSFLRVTRMIEADNLSQVKAAIV